MYPNIESIEEDGSATRVKVTMSKPSYPIASLFSYVVHPKMTDTDFFANGLVDKPNSDYAAGPFKVAEGGWNSTEKTLTVTRNDNGGAKNRFSNPLRSVCSIPLRSVLPLPMASLTP